MTSYEKPQSLLSPLEWQALLDDHRRGLSVTALAVRYGVHRRSVYRYLDARIERIYVDGWTAWFALHGDTRSPQRLTNWETA